MKEKVKKNLKKILNMIGLRKKDGVITDKAWGRLWSRESQNKTPFFKGKFNVRKALLEQYPTMEKVLQEHPEVQELDIVVVKMQPKDNALSPTHRIFKDESKLADHQD